MNGRVYSPKLGRMLSPDPVTQAPENGQNYDRYTYAFNNPLKYTDPSGYTNCGDTDNGGADACEAWLGPFQQPLTNGAFPSDAEIDQLDSYSDYLWGDYDHLLPQPKNDGCTGGLSLGGFCSGDNVGSDGEVVDNPPPSSYGEAEFMAEYGAILAAGGIDIAKNIEQARQMGLDDWIRAVRTGGIWDYKNNQTLINAEFSSGLLDEFGNVHFGIVAAAFGWNLGQTLSGAGLYQSVVQGGGSTSHAIGAAILVHQTGAGLLLPNSVARGLTEAGFTWGDNPGDSLNILKGWDFYANNY